MLELCKEPVVVFMSVDDACGGSVLEDAGDTVMVGKVSVKVVVDAVIVAVFSLVVVSSDSVWVVVNTLVVTALDVLVTVSVGVRGLPVRPPPPDVDKDCTGVEDTELEPGDETVLKTAFEVGVGIEVEVELIPDVDVGPPVHCPGTSGTSAQRFPGSRLSHSASQAMPSATMTMYSFASCTKRRYPSLTFAGR